MVLETYHIFTARDSPDHGFREFGFPAGGVLPTEPACPPTLHFPDLQPISTRACRSNLAFSRLQPGQVPRNPASSFLSRLVASKTQHPAVFSLSSSLEPSIQPVSAQVLGKFPPSNRFQPFHGGHVPPSNRFQPLFVRAALHPAGFSPISLRAPSIQLVSALPRTLCPSIQPVSACRDFSNPPSSRFQPRFMPRSLHPTGFSLNLPRPTLHPTGFSLLAGIHPSIQPVSAYHTSIVPLEHTITNCNLW